ncbi:MAG: tetratricopeptide repeat protein, partial [Actinomycetes bacterium]
MVVGSTPAMIERYEDALGELVRFRPEVEEHLDALVAEEPGFAPAALARAYLGVLTSEPGPSRQGLTVLAELDQHVPPDRLTPVQRGHREAIEAWSQGRFTRAQAALDRVSESDPHDLLALFAGHQLDFFLADAASLRDRLGRVLPEWDRQDPGYGFLLGMFAFGLEESGWYDRAEAVGTEALATNPEDVWALHAVVHTHEMRAEVDRGLGLMDRMAPYWTEGNAFNAHNYWHQALYLLELGDIPAVLDVYDRHLHNDGSAGVALEMLDASSLLWRLYLDGDAQETRFAALAEAWARWVAADEPYYVFNDCHAIMALAGAGRVAEAEHRVEQLRRYAVEGDGGADLQTNVTMTRVVGLPVAQALVSFAAGRYQQVVDRLAPIRGRFYTFGGSHAQRDAFHRTLLEAAIRVGDTGLARTLVNERISVKEYSPYNWV